MGNILMTRVDARLVHGQVGARISKLLHLTKIAIVEDEVANDEFMVDMFSMCAPAGIVIECYTLEDGVKRWKQDQFGDGNIMILFKYPQTAVKAWENGLNYKELNVAQVPMAPGRRRIVSTVHLSPSEIEMLTKMVTVNHVDVYNQAIPDDKRTPILDAIKAEN